MKKRLRKKLRVGEFREFIFQVSFEPNKKLSADAHNAFFDSFIDMIEQNGLQFGGLWTGCVELNRRGSVTEQHRQIVLDWLTKHPDIHNIEIGELIDGSCDRD